MHSDKTAEKSHGLPMRVVPPLLILIMVGANAASLWFHGVLPKAGGGYWVEAFADDHLVLCVFSLWGIGVFVTPVLEELIFRGFLYRGFAASLGEAGAVVLTSLAFGLLHGTGDAGWEWVGVYTTIGLLLGWLRWRSGGVIAPILAHASLNIFLAAAITAVAGVFWFAGSE